MHSLKRWENREISVVFFHKFEAATKTNPDLSKVDYNVDKKVTLEQAIKQMANYVHRVNTKLAAEETVQAPVNIAAVQQNVLSTMSDCTYVPMQTGTRLITNFHENLSFAQLVQEFVQFVNTA